MAPLNLSQRINSNIPGWKQKLPAQLLIGIFKLTFQGIGQVHGAETVFQVLLVLNPDSLNLFL
jgi:hypothetical protein